MSLSITVSFMLGSLADVVGPAAYDFQVNELMVVMQTPVVQDPVLSSHAAPAATHFTLVLIMSDDDDKVPQFNNNKF